MRPEDLLNALNPALFRPFMIDLTNGESYPITHPDQILVGRSSLAIGTQRRDGERRFGKIVTCGLVHVVSLAPIEETAVE